jgi:hypothetical protein
MSVVARDIAEWWRGAERAPPDLRLFAGLVLTFAALAAGSYIDPRLSAAALCVFLGLTAVLLPVQAVAVLIVSTPFRNLFALDPVTLDWLLGLLMAALAVRLGHHLTSVRNLGRSLLLAIAAYLVLIALRTGIGEDPLLYAQSVGFVLTLLVIAIAVRDLMAQPGFPRLMGAAFATGLVLVAGFSIAAMALPSLDLVHGLAPDIGYRLIGAHDNPNALAKFLLLYFAFLVAMWPKVPASVWQGRAVLLSGAVLAIVLLSATVSRSSMLALLIALLALVAWRRLRGQRAAARMPLCLLGLCVLIFGVWQQWLGPAYVEWSKWQWLTEYGDEQALQALEDARADRLSFAEKARSGLRLDEYMVLTKPKGAEERLPTTSSEVYSGDVTYTPVPCEGILCLGARGNMWRLGWQAIQSNWMFGIGFRGWANYYQEHLGFPFDSPHSAMLELWGGLGVAGLLVYMGLAFAVLARLGPLLVSANNAGLFPFATAGLSFTALMLLNEIPDPAKVLSVSPHAVWIWLLLALGEGEMTSAGQTQALS